MKKEEGLQTVLQDTFALYDRVLDQHEAKLRATEIGIVQSIGQGIAKIVGLPHVQSEEIVRFTGGSLGLVFNLDPEEVGALSRRGFDAIEFQNADASYRWRSSLSDRSSSTQNHHHL